MAYRTQGTGFRRTVAGELAVLITCSVLLLGGAASQASARTFPTSTTDPPLTASPEAGTPFPGLDQGDLTGGAGAGGTATLRFLHRPTTGSAGEATDSTVLAKPHPAHTVRKWPSSYHGRTYYVVELPRCEHMEAVFSHEPSGETKDRAQNRLGGVAVCTGSFHHPRTMALADFLQKDGNIVSGATTGRWFFAVTEGGHVTISNDYQLLKGRPGVSAIALGQRLVPLHQDGFSKAFMNQVTERMALGLSEDHIYIVRGRSDLWRLSAFMQSRLPVAIAINSDGGHVVRGRAPVHIVFRWRTQELPAVEAITPPSAPLPATMVKPPVQGRQLPAPARYADIALAYGEALPVHLLQEGEQVLAGGAEQLARFADAHATVLQQVGDDLLASSSDGSRPHEDTGSKHGKLTRFDQGIEGALPLGLAQPGRKRKLPR